MQFSKRLDRFGEEIFAALNNRRMELEAQGMKIYNMSVGTPDFKTPEHIKKALAEAAMDDNNWKYSLRDLPELLEAVCDYYKKRFDVELTPDMVMTVYGSQEGMGHLGMALCDEGDVVLLPDPCYPVFDGRGRAILLPACRRARFSSICKGYPGGSSTQSQIHGSFSAIQPGRKHCHTRTLRRDRSICEEI